MSTNTMLVEAEKKLSDLKNQVEYQKSLISQLKTPKTSSEAINLDEKTARRMYKNFSKEIQSILEKKFGKGFYDKPAREFINNYQDICDELGVKSDESSIQIEVEGFDSTKLSTAKNFIKSMRISEVYRKGRLPKDGEKRYYAYWKLDKSAPSGLRFNSSSYVDDCAVAASAAHLCFFTEEDAKDAAIKFPEIYSELIGTKLILGIK